MYIILFYKIHKLEMYNLFVELLHQNYCTQVQGTIFMLLSFQWNNVKSVAEEQEQKTYYWLKQKSKLILVLEKSDEKSKQRQYFSCT